MKKLKVNFTHDESVVQVILDDGKGNVLDSNMIEELTDIMRTIKDMPAVKLVTFEGAGKHFSFGASIEEHQKEYAATMLHSFHQLFYLFVESGIPALAKVSGQCLGGGMELALICNFIFADKTARFGQPEIILGVIPPPASIILPEKIGYARAEELLITGRTFTADEAKNYGLIIDVFDDKDTMNSLTESWIQQHILPKSASSLRYSVKAARIKFNHVLSNFLPALEETYLKKLMNTKDANEGIQSFIEKRKPVWENC